MSEPKKMELGPVDYGGPPPARYRCVRCDRHGCKLWRQYQTLADHIELLCCDCAGKDQKRDVSSIDGQGNRPDDDLGSGLTCTIAWLVPAVPTVEGDTYWGYSSIPEDGVTWWRGLPTRVPSPVR